MEGTRQLGLVLQMHALEDDVAVHGQSVEVPGVHAVFKGADEYVVDVDLKPNTSAFVAIVGREDTYHKLRLLAVDEQVE